MEEGVPVPSIPRGRRVAAAIASLALAASVLIPVGGVASAASTTTCPPREGGPFCELLISAPESVVTGTPFTVQVSLGYWTQATELTPSSFVVANSDPCAKVSVTLNVSDDAWSGSYTSTAAAGVATFQITIPYGTQYDSTYQMSANGPGGTLAPSTTGCGSYSYGVASQQLTAVFVPQDQPIAPCPDDTVCVQTTSGGGSAATLFSIDGHWDTAQFVPQSAVPPDPNGVLMQGVCPIQASQDPNGTLLFHNPTATADKTIVLALKRELVTQGIAQFRICWSGTTLFTPLGGGPPVYTGDLPSCSKTVPAPCVLFKKSNKLNTGFFGVLAPFGASNDPAVRPH
jgi:hypothetical protein